MTQPRDELKLVFHCGDMPGYVQDVVAEFDARLLAIPLGPGHQINIDLVRVVVTDVVHDLPTEEGDRAVVWVTARVGSPWMPSMLLRRLAYVPMLSGIETPNAPEPCDDPLCYLCGKG